jgi:hypothetical protein
MILVTQYISSFRGQHTGRVPVQAELPKKLSLPSDSKAHLTWLEAGIEILIEIKIDRDELVLSQDRTAFTRGESGEEFPVSCLRLKRPCREDSQVAQDLTVALSFFLEVPLKLYSSGASRLVAEDEADERRLAELKCNKLCRDLHARDITVTSQPAVLTESQVVGVLDRCPRLHIYSDALNSPIPSAQFRDYWRVLESAFGLIDDDLVDALSAYPPARELHLDREELRSLLALRGRASHAKSRKGISEISEVNLQCTDALPRLKSLAKRVILTKKSWGIPANGVSAISPFVQSWSDAPERYW